MGTTEKQILEQVERIRQLRSQGASDSQIIEEMKLSYGDYWRRIKRMNQIDRQILVEKSSTQLPSEVRILEDRMCRTIKNCESITRDTQYLRECAKQKIRKYIDERLPEEYEKCLVGLTAILFYEA